MHPDTHLIFDGYEIAPLKNVVETAKRLHGLLPQIKMISWDWSLDRNNVPVLIEINISGQAVWFNQMVNGESIFGDHTEYFANMIRKK
jgi:D-alanine-D-alanine ligase-like ATP-grasp enzyme